MLKSTHISMGFGLCKCADCRKPWKHRRYRIRQYEYDKITKKWRKKYRPTQAIEKFEDFDFTTCKYTD